MTFIKENLASITDRIVKAAMRAGRDPETVQLVAVSKRKPVAMIQEALAAGQRLFGENYLQEAAEKIAAFDQDMQWHFIGHLQSNKAKAAAELFDMIETVDRLKLAKALDKYAGEAGKKLSVLVQVNIGKEPQKAGVLPEDAEQLLRDMGQFPNLAIRGLMTMPPYFDDPEGVRPYFSQMRELAAAMAAKGILGHHGPVELSMGMSGDFEVAIEEGATLVRVGTALFGERE